MSEKAIQVQEFEKITSDDLSNISVYLGASLDDVVADIGIPDQAYTGFPTVNTSAFGITVGSGRLYWNGDVYFNDTDGGYEIDLSASLPLVTSNYIAVVVYGQELDAEPLPRTFLTDATTRATVARVIPTEKWRWANIGIYVGNEGPTPVKPAVPSNLLVVAWVLCTPDGVTSIAMDLDNKAPSVRDAQIRLNENDAFRATVGAALNTLRSDINNIANRFHGLASESVVEQIALDVARLKEKAGLPSTYTSYGADHFLNTSGSDLTNVSFYARIEEGVRFPWYAVQDDQISLLNAIDPNAVVAGSFLVPPYEPDVRISKVSLDLGLSIAQYNFQTVASTQITVARTRIRYGTPYIVCSNTGWIQSASGVDSQGNLLIGGETYRVDDPFFIPGGFAWPFYRVTEVFTDTYYDTYWQTIASEHTAGGATIAETFLNTQAGYLTEIGLYFEAVAETGDVTLQLCKCTSAGAPDLTSVIASCVVAAANLQPSPNRTPFPMVPTILDAGSRYAFVLTTPGDHFVWTSQDNKFTDGSLFTSTDGAFFVGDLQQDICFDAVFALFDSPYVEIQLQPLELAGGIVAIDMLAMMSVPPGTSLTYAWQDATGNWNNMNETSPAPTNLPPALPLKVILSGTTAVMPGLGVLSNSRQRTARPAPTMTFISIEHDMAAAVNHVTVVNRLEGPWNSAYHTFACSLLTGTGFTTAHTPDVETRTPALDDPTALVVTSTFNIASLSAFKIKCAGTTTTVLACFFIAEQDFVGVP